MNKLIIDRSKWACGNSKFNKGLLVPGMGRCCLGFLGQECGLKDYLAARNAIPSTVICTGGVIWPSELFELNFSTGYRNDHFLTIINDYVSIDNETRESWIAASFKYLLDYNVEFINEYE